MQRPFNVTLTASAVTLACLAAAFYASPVVIAENMGREIQSYAPVNGGFTSPADDELSVGADSTGQAREQSTMANDGIWQTIESEIGTPEQAPTKDGPTQDATVDSAASPQNTLDPTPAETPTSRITSELPSNDTDRAETEATDTASPTTAPDDEAEDANIPEDLDSPDSTTVIVNKARPLPSDFSPDDLVELPDELTVGSQQVRERAAEATEEMFKAAEDDGVELQVVSSYRSYEYQQRIYDSYLDQFGVDNTDAMSARPGYSEHQTGLAMDVDTPDGDNTLTSSFGDTEAGQWLADHAHEYGFVIRFPKDQEDITGFQYEPWHLRYFSEQYARHVAKNSGVAETDFGLEPAPDYED